MPLTIALGKAVIGLHQRLTGAVEAVTYYAKATPTSSAVEHAVTQAIIRNYRLSQLLPEAILPTDQECRIPTSVVTWTPTDYDEIVRSDTTRWRIQSITGGPGYPFYVLQLRQVG